MSLVAHRVGVAGPHGPLLLPTTLVAEPGEVTLVVGDPGPGTTALALVLGGRLAHDEGGVLLDGDADAATRRRRVALVDLSGVTAPEGGLPVSVVVGEELALAGLPSRRRHVETFLAGRDATDLADTRWENVPPAQRTRWLLDVAPAREGIDVVVLAGPDRHGGDPHDWFADARRVAERGLVVVALCTHASARLLGHEDAYAAGVA